MPTLRLPGGHRITGIPDIRPGRDFTPTFEEAFWAYVMPPNLYRIFSDKSGEQLLYFSSKLGLATVGMYLASGQSLTALNMMRAGMFATSPLGMMTFAAVAGTMSQFEVAAHHGAGTRGSPGSIAPSYHLVGGKPWWQ